MAEIRSTQIRVGSNTILTCWDGKVDYELDQMILIGLEGWDTYGTEISTERKLFGAGSYVVDKHLPERVVSLEIAEFNELSGLKASLDSLKSIIKDFEEVRIIRTYEANGGTRTEELRGIVRAITDYEIVYDDFRRVGIEILCPDPTMIINGVIPPTPEEPEYPIPEEPDPGEDDYDPTLPEEDEEEPEPEPDPEPEPEPEPEP